MLMNNVLIVVVNVRNLNVISFDTLIHYLIYLVNILEQVFDIPKKDVDHVLQVFVIHVEYYLDKFRLDEE